MESYSGEMCPRCGGSRWKSWDELDEAQKILATKLPASAVYSEDERREHRFCTRCFFEEIPPRQENV